MDALLFRSLAEQYRENQFERVEVGSMTRSKKGMGREYPHTDLILVFLCDIVLSDMDSGFFHNQVSKEICKFSS